jgi:phage anti-repressor protein
MGYNQHKKAIDRIKTLVDNGDLIVDTDVRIAEERVLSTGNMRTVYYFSLDGIKLFFMASCTPEARKFRMYFIKIEKEYNKVLPELEKLQEENERLRKEKEALSDYQRWRATREDGIKAHHTAMDNLKHIVQGIEGPGSAKLYAIVNDAINKAVLNFTETTRAFKKSRGYHDSLSIPDVLDGKGQKERAHVLEKFLRFFENHYERLCQLPVSAIIDEVSSLGRLMGRANSMAGDLKRGLLNNGEALARKKQRVKEAKAASIHAARPSTVINIDNRVINNNTFNNTGEGSRGNVTAQKTATNTGTAKGMKTLFSFFKRQQENA